MMSGSKNDDAYLFRCQWAREDAIPEVMVDSSDSGYPKKRARTRAQLRQAGLEAIAAHGPEATTVGEIAKRAGVAQGTFYNHFPSLADLMDEIADQLGTGVEIARDALDAIESDPAGRVAIGVLQLLDMADRDPTAAAAFVSLAAARQGFRGRVRAIIGRAIADGVDTGRFRVETGPPAVNAVLGTCLQSMRSIVLAEADGSIAPAVALLVLRSLGVDDGDAEQVVSRAAGALIDGGAERSEVGATTD